MPVPNEADATYLDQSEIDSIDTKMWERMARGYHVFNGGAVTAQGTPDGTVAVSSGSARVTAVTQTIAAGNVSVLSGAANPDGSTAAASDATGARFDLITVNASGQLGVVHGQVGNLSATNDGSYDAVFPEPFDTGAAHTVLAAIFIPPTFTTISNSMIVDKRILSRADTFHDTLHTLNSTAVHSGSISVAQGLGKSQQLTGATSATNYVGGTASVAPTSGTFAVGDFVITQTGKIYVCTTAGTPGTWTAVSPATLIGTDTFWAAKGDLAVASANDTAAVLSVGTALTDRLIADTAAATGMKWVPHFISKTADETVSASTAVQNDDHLFFTIGASELWFFQMFLQYSGANATMDLKVGWLLPAGGTVAWGAFVQQTPGVSDFARATTAQTPGTLATSTLSFATNTTTPSGVALAGWLTNSTTAGTANFQWAQNTSDAGALKLLTGSSLLLWRCA